MEKTNVLQDENIDQFTNIDQKSQIFPHGVFILLFEKLSLQFEWKPDTEKGLSSIVLFTAGKNIPAEAQNAKTTLQRCHAFNTLLPHGDQRNES